MAKRLLAEAHPLLGMRVASANPTWQQSIDSRVLEYLDDHRFWDGIIFPASGYGEIGIAVARELFPEESYAVEDLQSRRAMFVSEDNPPTVQVVYDEEQRTFRVFGSTDEQEWELNAEGRLVACEFRPALFG